MQTPETTFLNIEEVKPRAGKPSTSTLYRWMDSKRFPRPIKLGPQKVAWRLSDIDAWASDPSGWAAAQH